VRPIPQQSEAGGSRFVAIQAEASEQEVRRGRSIHRGNPRGVVRAEIYALCFFCPHIIQYTQELFHLLTKDTGTVQTSQKPKVFLSYAREDQKTVYKIYHFLKNNGADPWLDVENLLPGQDWEYEIEVAIENSHYFIACLSENSVTKTGYVQVERLQGLEQQKRRPEGAIYVIPVRLDDCKPSRSFSQQTWHDWFNTENHHKLLKAIGIHYPAIEEKSYVVAISGSYRSYDTVDTRSLCHVLGVELAKQGYPIISGLAQGGGLDVSLSAYDYLNKVAPQLAEKLITGVVTPKGARAVTFFGQRINVTDGSSRTRTLVEKGRGFIFIGGANGTWQEYQEFKQLHRQDTQVNRTPIALGCTGGTTKRIWAELEPSVEKLYRKSTTKAEYSILNDEDASEDQIVEIVLKILNAASAGFTE
jgi:predicted Rossmann-fold nucleotide-binding protein